MQQPTKFSDYFALLGVTKETSSDDIRKAFTSKALQYHPDKADPENREQYSKIYQDLKDAYKILTDPRTRQQYIDAQSATIIELREAPRDVGYATPPTPYDRDAFMNDFNTKRHNGADLSFEDKPQAAVTTNDFESYIKSRDQQIAAIEQERPASLYGVGQEFNSNLFNRSFDLAKERAKLSGGLQEYVGDPRSMFSGGALEETDVLGGIDMINGYSFEGRNLDSLYGESFDSKVAVEDIANMDGTIPYWQESKLSWDDIQKRTAEIEQDRVRLATLQGDQFKVERTEIERMYADLFAPLNVLPEGIESQKVTEKQQTEGETRA